MEGIITVSDAANRSSQMRIWEAAIEFSNVEITGDFEQFWWGGMGESSVGIEF